MPLSASRSERTPHLLAEHEFQRGPSHVDGADLHVDQAERQKIARSLSALSVVATPEARFGYCMFP